MNTRRLGRSGPEVSALGLGCMGMSEFYGDTGDEAASIAVIHRALELGVTFLDTAEIYGLGHNETLVGKALAGRRDQAVLATKFGIQRDAAGQFVGLDSSPAKVRASCEGSLRRLGVEAIDVYYQHRVDPATPIEETVGALAELVKEGKVRHLGLSEASPETLRRACAVHPIAALQTEYSLFSRDPDGGLLATCAELGVAFVAYSPLGRGFLSGKIRSPEDLGEDDWRRSSPRFQGENFARNLELAAKLDEVGGRLGVTSAQVALAWLLTRGEHVVPIPGTRSPKRLEQNAAAAEVELDAATLEEIEAVFPLGAVAGERYDARSMTVVNG